MNVDRLVERIIKNYKSIPQEHRTKVVCAALINKRIIYGWNSNKTSPKYKKVFPDRKISFARHAEIHTLSQLKENEKISFLLVVRIRKDGSLGCSKPCPSCEQRLLEVMSSKKIFYFDGSGNFQRLKEI